MRRISVAIDGIKYQAKKGELLIEVAKRNRHFIPTLCYHPRLENQGTCRICCVERAGDDKLVSACTTRLERDGEQFTSKSAKLDEYVKANLSLVLQRHPDDCATCRVAGNCELQDLFYKYQVGNQWLKNLRKLDGQPQYCSHSLETDMQKCILCGRCEDVCANVQGLHCIGLVGRGQDELPTLVEGLPPEKTPCISCGQCALVCPVGAITERWDADIVRSLLERREPNRRLVAQIAPSSKVAIGELFGMKPGTLTEGKLVAALKHIGFDNVVDVTFAADVTVIEEGAELLRRVEAGGPFPMFTSCCPGWVTLAEKMFPEYLSNLSSCKSPQQSSGRIMKETWSGNVTVVSIMPCTAKKEEAEREGMSSDVDYVLTTREIGHLIKESKVEYVNLRDEPFDDIVGVDEDSSGAGILFGSTGGVMESALRTLVPQLTLDYSPVKGLSPVKEATVELGDETTLRVAVVHSTKHAIDLMHRIKRGELEYHFVEVMACEGGCIGGGGQPKSNHKDVLQQRQLGVYRADATSVIRRSSDSPGVQSLYERYLSKAGSPLAKQWLHTKYHDRSDGVVRRD